MPRNYQKALRVLESLLMSENNNSDNSLPSARVLAKHHHLSRDTIRGALRILAQKKMVTFSKNAPARACKSIKKVSSKSKFYRPDTDMPHYSGNVQWKRTAEKLKEDILNGTYRFSHGRQLPSLKELKHHYGVCYQTLKKAIAHVAGQGFISEHGVIDVSSHTHQGPEPVVLLIVDEFFLQRVQVSERRNNLFRLLEVECRMLDIGMSIIHVTGNNFKMSIQKHINNANVLGLIVNCSNQQVATACVNNALPFNLPIAVIDESGELQSTFPGHVQVFIFGAILRAGSQVGRFLLGLGHRHIAFFSTRHDHLFSHNRYTALQKTFADSNFDTSVKLYAASSSDTRMFQNFLKTPGQALPLRQNSTYSGLLDASVAFGKTIQHVPHFSDRMHAVDLSLIDLASTEQQYETLRPFLEEALIDRRITAWVFADDIIAVLALFFLTSRGISVPDRISVIGFEDIFEAFSHGLTTYNFNLPSLISRCLHWVRFHTNPTGKRSNKPIEIAGHIIERKTTGAARL